MSVLEYPALIPRFFNALTALDAGDPAACIQ
jgi:hypothetical protein